MDGDYYLKEEVIRLRYENQNLKEENEGLREKLEKAYEFMKKFVIEGKSVLDKVLEWIGEKVREGRERYLRIRALIELIILLNRRFHINIHVAFDYQ